MDKRGSRNAGLRGSDIEKLRKKIKIGQKLKYEYLEYDTSGRDMVLRIRKRKAVVVRKYPHLVEVEPVSGGKRLPVRTMTYIEIAISERSLL